MTIQVKKLLPSHLKHLQHSKLFNSLEKAVSIFTANKIVSEEFLLLLVTTLGEEFEKMYDRPPVNSRVVDIAENSSIANYRFDRGYWELVVPSTSVMVTDKAEARTIFFADSIDLAVEGSGSGLRKGKRKSQSIQRAHTRQIARDTRYESSDDSQDDEDEEWKP